jgi:2'-5' RNA ligase
MRAFIAVPVSDSVRRKAKALGAATKGPGASAVKPENMHVTLFFLGEIGERRKADAIAALDAVTVPEFKLEFRGAGAFPNPNFVRVLWIGCESEPLRRIHAQLEPAILKMGYKKEPFKPHLTVARVSGPEAKDAVRAALAKYADSPFGSCTVSRIALYKSTLSPKGAIYEEIHSTQLPQS